MLTTNNKSFLDTLTPDRREECLSAFARGFQAGLVGTEQPEERSFMPSVDSLVSFFRAYPGPSNLVND